MRMVMATAAVAAWMAAPGAWAQGDPQPSILELLDPNRLAGIAAHLGIAALRTQMEMSYEHLATDISRGTVAISGLVVRPPLPWDRAGQCAIRIDRATLRTDLVAFAGGTTDAALNVVGITADLACLERDLAVPLRTAGYDAIVIDQMRMQAAHDHPTGETVVDVTLAVNGVGMLDLSGAGTILPRLGPYGTPGTPAVRVTHAMATLRDSGGWAALSALLPENLRDPEAVRALGTESLTDALSDGGTTPLTAVERNFVDALMDRVAAFVGGAGELTIEASLPAGGAVIEPEWMDDPAALIAALALSAQTVPAARARVLTAADLAPEGLDDAGRLVLAHAFLSGDGVPRSAQRAADILDGMTAATGADAAEAAALTAEALAGTDAGRAYGLALRAAALGAAGSVALLDRLEANMPSARVLELQRDSEAAFPSRDLHLTGGDDPRTLRAAALAYLTGRDAPRSYGLAYQHALWAQAAGDAGAAALIDEIEGRFRGRGEAVAALWREEAARREALAVDLWISADMGARYRRE